MTRTTIRILNAALLVVCCFFAARMIVAVAGEALAPTEAAVAPLPPREPPHEYSWEDRKVILENNPFNVSTLAPTPIEAPQEEDLEKTKLPLRLLGTAATADPETARAAVEDLDTRTHLVVRVGDVLKGRAEVLRIERRRIVLQNGPNKEELGLEEEAGEATAQRRPAPQPSSARTARARPSRPSAAERRRAALERLGRNRGGAGTDVRELANDASALFSALSSQARILPKYEEGEMVGFQLNAIRPGSLVEECGLENGDTVTEVNGTQVTSQESIAEALQQMGGQGEVSLTVSGSDGEVRQLRCDLS
jgi:general secretion pathway protein C